VCVCRSISGLVPALQGAADPGVSADGHGVGQQVRSGTSGRQILHQTQQHCVHTGHAPKTAHTGSTTRTHTHLPTILYRIASWHELGGKT